MYLDPSEGRAGRTLDSLYGAATSGALQVDPRTGETTLKFLNQVQDLTNDLARRARSIGVQTPLGGGFGAEIGSFNQRLANGGSDSAQEVLEQFGRDLERLKQAVAKSMESYRNAESGNARSIANAGAAR